MRWITLLIFILFAISITLAFLGQDEAPPEDDALQLSIVAIPEKQNAYTYFNKAVDKMYWPKEKEQLILNMLDGKQWDAKLVAELMKKNKKTFPYFNKALNCSVFQDPGSVGFTFYKPGFRQWRNLVRLVSIRAVCLFKEGKEKESFDEAMKIIKLGHFIDASQGGIVSYFVGVAIKDLGLARLRTLLITTTLSPEVLNTYIDEIRGFMPNEEGLAQAAKWEYMLLCTIIDDPQYYGQTRTGFYFKPNMTKRIFFQRYKLFINNIPKTWANMEKIKDPDFVKTLSDVDFDDLSFKNLPSLLKLMVTENAVGKSLYGICMPRLNRILMRKCQKAFSVSATALLFALKCYKTNTGKLPESLDELVPEYIPEVPDDPFDGNPIRYSPEKKIIYSVGEDLIDSGGNQKEELDMKEPTLTIEF